MSEPSLGTYNTFGELLRYLRRHARLTQRELGLAVGYSEAHITRLEAGQRLPDPDVVRGQFISALALQQEPATAQRLIDLAGCVVVAATPAEPAEVVPSSIPNNLPVQLTRFIGREQEVTEVKGLVGTHRLVTLTGSGGVGKTRLALEVASAFVDGGRPFADGVWLMELAPLADPVLVPRTAAAVLGVHEERDRPLLGTLTDHLHEIQLLLILDNCEHLIDACARFAEDVLRRCREVRILASSREALGIAGELAWRVPSLPQAEAVRLFAERAELALPSFALTSANTPAVEQICDRLDGIPLAIELAASRLKVLPVERIAERLGDRFRLLTGGSRTALPRQQTLRGTIDWSYSLLSEPERTLLRRLSVFMGGWTLEAAEAVCADAGTVDATASGTAPPPSLSGPSLDTSGLPREGAGGLGPDDVLDALTRLVDKSLVVADETGRYRMQETIRQYAREKLVDTDEVLRLRDRHLDTFVRLAEEVEPQLLRGSRSTLDRLALEVDNLRAALEWAKEMGRVEEGLRLAAALEWFWVVRGYQLEGLMWLRSLLAQPVRQVDTPGRARAFLAMSALLVRYEGSAAEGEAVAQWVLSIARTLGLQREAVAASLTIGWAMLVRNDLAAARKYVEQGREMVGALTDKYLWQRVLWSLTILALAEDDNARATEYAHQMAAVDPGNSLITTAADRFLGYGLLDRGEVQAARARFRESLIGNAEVGDRQAVAACLTAFAVLALADGDPRRSAQLLGAAEAIIDAIHTPLQPHDLAHNRRMAAELGAKLDEAALKEAWATGRAMSYDQAVAYALLAQ
jgi:non-specific serine/threonine protein kinase